MRRASPILTLLAGCLFILAGCASREIPMTTLQARYGLPSSHHFEPEPGLRVHYTDEGDPRGPTLILVHGFAASGLAWRPWIERLSDRYRLIAIDLPGHGLTEAPKGYRATLEGNAALVDKLADLTGSGRFVLVGNSMGGAVALTYALQHPDRLDGLVLVDSAGGPPQPGKAGEGPPAVFQLLNNSAGRAILKAFDPKLFATDGLKSAYLDRTLVTPALVDRYADLAMAPGHRDILLTQDSRPANPVTTGALAKLAVPTLVMAGEQDRLIPVANSRALAAAIPGARLVIYPDGGHVPMEQLPDRSSADLVAFLKTLRHPPAS